MREEEQLQQHLQAPFSRRLRTLGWWLLALGAAPLIGYLAWQLWQDPAIPVWMKFSLSALWLGGLMVFFSVLRQRLQERRRDRYSKQVQL